jgi:hypothetical protein
LHITENIRLSKSEVVRNYLNEFRQTLELTDKEIHENENYVLRIFVQVNQIQLKVTQ